MRVLCLLLFCLSAVAAINLGFKRGKRYSYKYEGWVAHGVAEAFKKDLAVKIRAITHFDYLTNGYVRMTLQDVKLAKIVDKVLYNDRLETAKVDVEQPIEDVNGRFKLCLELPVKFRFKSGAVEAWIITEKKSPEWCVNIQRAIINQFYLPIKDNKEKYQIRENEISVLGRCKTAYTIIAEKPYYKVKRAIDLTRCTIKPEIFQISLPNTDAFFLKRPGRGTAKELPSFVRKAAYMHFDLDGNVQIGFIIRQVVTENVGELTLNGDEYAAGKVVAAHSRQVLTLLAKEQPIPDSAKDIQKERRRTGLMFVFDDDKTAIESDDGQVNVLREVRAHIATIKQHLQTGNVLPETAMEFTRLVSNLRHCTFKSLEKIFKEVMDEPCRDLRRVCLDAIARVGTKVAGELLKGHIMDVKVKKELRRILFGVGWVRGLNIDYTRHVMEICEHTVVSADIKHHRNCWLSFGTLVNRLMVKMRRDPRMGQDIRLVTFRHLIAKTLKEAIQSTTNEEKKITYLKAIGNAGWITYDVFKCVCDVIYKANTPLHVRVQAIWALRHMARVQPLMVRQKLLPILANPLADPELRISCYKILMQSDPSLLTCQMIASVIAREAAGLGPRSNQLVSFVTSDLRTSINYDNIDMVKASRARLLLRVIPRKVSFQMFSYSKGVNIPIDRGNKFVTELRFSKINVPQTFIPRHIHTKIKVNMPGISADFFEFGTRIQGVHDTILPYLGPRGNREKRSLDILRYIFGKTEPENSDVTDETWYQEKLPTRVAAYFKLYGSEFLYSKMNKEDIVEIIRDGLFGESTAKEGGCNFTSEAVKCRLPFTQAHMVSEKRYMIPTMVGIPLKYSGKLGIVLKGLMAANITGLSQLITSKFDEIKAKIIVKPTLSLHMHHKVGAWLPVFETGVIVNHQLFSQPKINFVLNVHKRGYSLEAPITEPEQQLWNVKPSARGLMRKELAPGNREWVDIDLQLRDRGFVEVPETCYGQDYLNLKLCMTGRVVDPEYLRLKLLPSFPYTWLNTIKYALKNDETNMPTSFVMNYDITTNTDDLYKGMGMVKIKGKTMDIEGTMEPTCDKTTWTCTTKWTFKHKQCPQTCTAETTMDHSQQDKLVIDTKYDGGHKEMNHEILIGNEGKEMTIVNTWNELPEEVHDYLRLRRPYIITWLHRYFGIKGAMGSERRLEVKIKLFNKYLADIFVDAPTMKLRRINQVLPIAINKFNGWNKVEMLKQLYGTCLVSGTNYIETTDNVVIKEEIPSTCPFVLAEDTQGEQAEWRMLLRKAEGGRQILIVEIGERRVEFDQDRTVKVDGSTIELHDGFNSVPGGNVTLVGSKLYYKADFGFQCMFDGSTTLVLLSPWWHNRIQGICGNNDGEQWTDFKTRRKTFIPERMTKEFLREWVVEGKSCKDKECKLKGQHIKLTSGAPAGKVCFTIGRFLRCVSECTVHKKHVLQKVPYHCLPANSPLVPRIKAGDVTVSMETMSVDIIGPVEEDLTCVCNCQ